MKIASPAKINLNLRVAGRRPDGFHEIETLMVPLTLADELEVELTEGSGVEIECDMPGIPTGQENLAARAASVFFEETGKTGGARVRLKKRIPAGAGLGGGSGNAAAMLVALDRLHGTRLGEEALETLAARVGSDAPWFVRARPALCRGRGEILEPHLPPRPRPALLAKPPFGVSTPWAYRRWSELGRRQEMAFDLDGLRIFNDLEIPVFEKYTLLPVMRDWLAGRPGVLVAAMSGSGSTLFAVLEEEGKAEPLGREMRERFGKTLWTRACWLGR